MLEDPAAAAAAAAAIRRTLTREQYFRN